MLQDRTVLDAGTIPIVTDKRQRLNRSLQKMDAPDRRRVSKCFARGARFVEMLLLTDPPFFAMMIMPRGIVSLISPEARTLRVSLRARSERTIRTVPSERCAYSDMRGVSELFD